MQHSNAFNSTRERIKRLTSFNQKQGPITYIGCPLFFCRPSNIYFSDLLHNVFFEGLQVGKLKNKLWRQSNTHQACSKSTPYTPSI